jgi:hypothetical protein
MSTGSISKKKNPTPEKGIRKMRRKKIILIVSSGTFNGFHISEPHREPYRMIPSLVYLSGLSSCHRAFLSRSQ